MLFADLIGNGPMVASDCALKVPTLLTELYATGFK